MIKRISSTLIIWNWIDDQRDLLYFDNLELKWWSRGFPLPQSGFGMMIKGISSTSIWLWDDDQRDLLYLDLDFFSTKSQNFKLDFNWQVLHGRTVFEMCDFHLLTLDLNFVKKSLINIRFFFWETFDLWNLEVLKFLFQILRLWNLEIFYLKFEILSLRILKIKAWNFDHEIWSLIFFFFLGWLSQLSLIELTQLLLS